MNNSACAGRTVSADEVRRAITVRLSVERSYGYTHPDTHRQFAIRRAQLLDAGGGTVTRYFLEELRPIGQRVERDHRGTIVRSRMDPRILETEALVGPNRLVGELQALGIGPEQIALAGSGTGVGSIYHDGLAKCARAIAEAINADERYVDWRPPTPQEEAQMHLRMRRESAGAYWSAEQAVLRAAQRSLQGLFRGCHTMTKAPLGEAARMAILVYLNAPSLEKWREIRGTMITSVHTLHSAWTARPLEAGCDRFPTPKALRAAIRSTIEARQREIEEMLVAAPLPSGLRVVEGGLAGAREVEHDGGAGTSGDDGHGRLRPRG